MVGLVFRYLRKRLQCELRSLKVVMQRFIFFMFLFLLIGGSEAKLLNGSFEEPVLNMWTPSVQVSFWNYADNTSWNGGYYGAGPRSVEWPVVLHSVDGRQFMVIRQYNIWQNTGVTIVENSTYTFSVYAASENMYTQGFKMSILASSNNSSNAPEGEELAVVQGIFRFFGKTSI